MIKTVRLVRLHEKCYTNGGVSILPIKFSNVQIRMAVCYVSLCKWIHDPMPLVVVVDRNALKAVYEHR